MTTSENNICQNCGTAIKEIADFGSNRDNSINTEYCRYCYKKGMFIDQGITLEEKMAKNIAMAEKMGISRKRAANLARFIPPKLRRWHKKGDLKVMEKQDSV